MHPVQNTMVLDQHLVLPRSDINKGILFVSKIDTRTGKSVWDTVQILKPLLSQWADRLALVDPGIARLRRRKISRSDIDGASAIDDLI